MLANRDSINIPSCRAELLQIGSCWADAPKKGQWRKLQLPYISHADFLTLKEL